MNNTYTIYKVTNALTGKVYIGFTSNYQNRIARHKYNSKYRNQHLYNSIRKYGLINFIFEEIYQSWDYIHCKNIMEPFFIKEYNSLVFGYNLTKGGEGCLGYTHTYKTKLKLSTIDKMGNKNPFFDKKHKTVTIEHNRQKNIEILTNMKGKSISQYSISGNLIQIHKSIRSAARCINKTHPSILKCCKGLLNHAHGYVWKYN